MDIIGFDVRCAECGRRPVGIEDCNFCLLCSGVFCTRHLIVEKGLATCAACRSERKALEDSSAVTEADEQHLVKLLSADLLATVGVGSTDIAIAEAARIRLFARTLPEFEQRVVDAVQQRLHDEFVDTTWPACPVHPNHPLWYSDAFWRCPVTGDGIARLGELANASQ
jgi:hypothetical protein